MHHSAESPASLWPVTRQDIARCQVRTTRTRAARAARPRCSRRGQISSGDGSVVPSRNVSSKSQRVIRVGLVMELH